MGLGRDSGRLGARGRVLASSPTQSELLPLTAFLLSPSFLLKKNVITYIQGQDNLKSTRECQMRKKTPYTPVIAPILAFQGNWVTILTISLVLLVTTTIIRVLRYLS